jgi:hypothetical protein
MKKKSALLYILCFANFLTCSGQNIKLNIVIDSIDKFPKLLSKIGDVCLKKMIEDTLLKRTPQSYKEIYNRSTYLYTSDRDSITKPDYVLDIRVKDTTSTDDISSNDSKFKVSGRIYENEIPHSTIPGYTFFTIGLKNLNEANIKKKLSFLIDWVVVMVMNKLDQLPYPTLLPPFNIPKDTIDGSHKTFIVHFIDDTNQKMPASVKQLKQLINNYFVLKQYNTFNLYKKTQQDNCYQYLLMEDAVPNTTSGSNVLFLPIKIQVERGNLKVSVAKNSGNVKLKSMGEAVQQVHIINPVVLEKYPSTLTGLQESFDWLIRINTAW